MSNALRLFLLADSSITTIVGTRIYLQRAPQSATGAYIRITPISAVPEQTHESALSEDQDNTRCQIDWFSADDTQVAALYPLIRARCLAIGSIPNSRYADPFDPDTQRWRGVMDVQFNPVDVPA